MKKVIVSILVLSMCLSICCQVFASAPSKSPMWLNIFNLTTGLSFIGTDGEASGHCTGKSGTTSIVGTLTVYKQSGSSWIYIDSVSGSTTTQRLNLYLDFEGVTGEYYKAVFEVVVTRNGIDEPETKTSYRTC